jgi:hypothetical protein
VIYRIVAETFDVAWDEATQQSRLVSGGLQGAFSAGVTQGFGEVPTPRLANRRARFYFTEVGWKQFGQAILAAAREEGRMVRVIRRKNPRKSQIVYQDAYQVAILSPHEAPADRHRR